MENTSPERDISPTLTVRSEQTAMLSTPRSRQKLAQWKKRRDQQLETCAQIDAQGGVMYGDENGDIDVKFRHGDWPEMTEKLPEKLR